MAQLTLLLRMCFLQIVSKGNDQVAMSSKFESREDPGEQSINFTYLDCLSR